MTGYLLDTSIVIWWTNSPSEIEEPARLILASARNQVFLSHASLWELAILDSLGRVKLPESLEQLVVRSRFAPLPISVSHIERVKALPFIHRDPFDRLLVAQSQVERLTLITRDRDISKYDVPTLAA